MNGLWTVMRGEVRRLLADPAILTILFGGALFYALFYPLPYTANVVRNVPIVVVDHDHSASSRQLVRMVDATEQVRVAGTATDVGRARADVRTGRVHGVLVVPAHFERDLLRGGPVTVGIYGNAAYVLLYSQLANGMTAAVGSFGAGVGIRRLEAGGAQQALAAVQPVALATRNLFNPGAGYGTYVVPAVLLLIAQQTLLIGMGMAGAGSQWHALPLRTVLGGRACVYMLLEGLTLLLLLSLTYGVYGYPRQASPGALALFLLPFVGASVLLGLTLCALFRSRETVLQCLMLLSVPMLFLAGFAWPAEAMPAALVWLGKLIPTTAAIDGFVRMNQMGASLHEVRGAWLSLWALVPLYGALAVLANHARRRGHSL